MHPSPPIPLHSPPTVLRRLWWLNPSWVFGMATVSTFLLALYLSDSAYNLYESPKYLRTDHLWIPLGAWLALEIGRRLGATWQRESGDSGERLIEDVTWWFFATFALTLGACSLLILRGLQNGLSLAVIKENLLAPPEDVSRELAGEVVVYIPGVTTATQFGIICALLGIWLYFRGRKYVAKYVAVIFGLAAMRALLFHERLALIEVVVPAGILVLREVWLGKRMSEAKKWLFQTGPILGLVGMIVMFGAFEYFRSWRHYRNHFTSISEFTIWRLGGYYSTSVNNGALGWERQGQRPLPFATLNAVWEFPPVEKSPVSYLALTGFEPVKAHSEMLKQYGNVEYNSLGGVFEPLRDYGPAGSIVWWVAFGAVVGWAYRGYQEGSLLGLLLFPIAFLALLEMPRFLYLTHPRALPALVVIAWLGWRIWKTRAIPRVSSSVAEVSSLAAVRGGA